MEHLEDFQHLDDLEVINEISENRSNQDNLRDLQSRASNEDTPRERERNTENPLPTQQSTNLGHRQTEPNDRVQSLGERRELSYGELNYEEKAKLIRYLTSTPTITYEIIFNATQKAIDDYLLIKKTNDKYQTKIDELTHPWRGDVVRGARLKEYEQAKSEIKLIRKLWGETEKHNFWDKFYDYPYKGVFRTWKKHRQELQKCFSEYNQIVIKYDKELKEAQEGLEKSDPELKEAKEKLSIYAEVLRIKAREKHGFTQSWEREVIAKKNLSTEDKDIIKTLRKLSYYRANPQELEPKVITRTISRSRGRSR